MAGSKKTRKRTERQTLPKAPMLTIERSQLKAHIGHTVAWIFDAADTLRGLGVGIDRTLGDFPSLGEPAELRELAACVRATAGLALQSAATAMAMGLSERLTTVAAVLDADMTPSG